MAAHSICGALPQMRFLANDPSYQYSEGTVLNQRSIAGLVVLLSFATCAHVLAEPLPNTKELTWTGDIAMTLVDNVDQFLPA